MNSGLEKGWFLMYDVGDCLAPLSEEFIVDLYEKALTKHLTDDDKKLISRRFYPLINKFDTEDTILHTLQLIAENSIAFSKVN